MNYQDFLSGIATIFVVGATQNKRKYGWRVFRSLQVAGFKLQVIPINPKYDEIEGQKCYASMEQAAQAVRTVREEVLVVTVVPPAVTEKVIEECRRLGITKIWMQPGSEEESTVRKCDNETMRCIEKACVVVDGYRLPLLIG